MPRIQRIRQVSSFATPSTGQVETDRGDTALLLKAEEDIRRLSATTLLIVDGHGIQFLIGNVSELDKGSRRLLDHFLRSEEHTSELQSLMRISYAVFCLTNKNQTIPTQTHQHNNHKNTT